MPNNFTYNTPTNVVFGKDTELRVGELIKEQKCTKALIHYGSASAEKSGLIARLTHTLEEAGVGYALLGGVKANPRFRSFTAALSFVKRKASTLYWPSAAAASSIRRRRSVTALRTKATCGTITITRARPKKACRSAPC
jgi:hypothetical protein